MSNPSDRVALPPSVLAQLLVRELACRLALLAIQPSHLSFGYPLSPPVRACRPTGWSNDWPWRS